MHFQMSSDANKDEVALILRFEHFEWPRVTFLLYILDVYNE